MALVSGVGINDLPGWATHRGNKDPYKYRVYCLWLSMLTRCYSEKFLSKYPSYRGCSVCDKWKRLSGFVDDLPKITGYEYWLNHPNEKVSLDKDIEVPNNKEYSLSTCRFVSNRENSAEMALRHTKSLTGMRSKESKKKAIATQRKNKSGTFSKETHMKANETNRKNNTSVYSKEVRDKAVVRAAEAHRKSVILSKDNQVLNFGSLTEAGNYLGVTKASISYALRKGTLCKGYKVEHSKEVKER